MDFDLQWLLLALPIAFALGWIGSRIDLRQWKREQKSSPKAYYKGLNLLLNEQQDKAIDAFIEAVQGDPDTTELHFALGNLFRRRGEFERAVRVHQHLMQRADLSATERERAQHALAQDYLKAGLFDRAEEAYRAPRGHAVRHRGATGAAAVARTLARLARRGRRRRAARDSRQPVRSRRASRTTGASWPWRPTSAATVPKPRPRWRVHARSRRPRRGPGCRPASAWPGKAAMPKRWPRGTSCANATLARSCWWPSSMPPARLAAGLADEALADAAVAATRNNRRSTCCRPSIRSTADRLRAHQRHAAHLARQPTLSAAAAVLRDDAGEHLQAGVIAAVDRAALPLQRYRCAACGFEAQHYFWQCPGCLSWDSYPPQRLEDQ